MALTQALAVSGAAPKTTPPPAPIRPNWLWEAEVMEKQVVAAEARFNAFGGKTAQNRDDVRRLREKRNALYKELDDQIDFKKQAIPRAVGKNRRAIETRVRELEDMRNWRARQAQEARVQKASERPGLVGPTQKNGPLGPKSAPKTAQASKPRTSASSQASGGKAPTRKLTDEEQMSGVISPTHRPPGMSQRDYDHELLQLRFGAGGDDSEYWYRNANALPRAEDQKLLGGWENYNRHYTNAIRASQRLTAAIPTTMLRGLLSINGSPPGAFDLGSYYDVQDRRFRSEWERIAEGWGTGLQKFSPVPISEHLKDAPKEMALALATHGIFRGLSNGFQPLSSGRGQTTADFGSRFVSEFGDEAASGIKIKVWSPKTQSVTEHVLTGEARTRFLEFSLRNRSEVAKIDDQLAQKTINERQAAAAKRVLEKELNLFKQDLTGQRLLPTKAGKPGSTAVVPVNGAQEVGVRTGGVRTKAYQVRRDVLGQPDLPDSEIDRIAGLENQARIGGHVQKSDELLKVLSDQRRSATQFESATLLARAKELRETIQKLDANDLLDPVKRKADRTEAVKSLEKIVKVVQSGGIDWARTGVQVQVAGIKSYKAAGLLGRARTQAGRALTGGETKLFTGQAKRLESLGKRIRQEAPGKVRNDLLYQQSKLKAEIEAGVSALGRTTVERVAATAKAVGKVRSAFEVAKPDTLRMLANHPILAVKILFKSIPSVTEKNATLIDKSMKSNRYFERMKAAGLQIEEITPAAGPTAMPIERFADNLPGVLAAGRVNATVVNQIRFNLMGGFLEKNPTATKEQVENFARWINVTTGHGTIASNYKPAVDMASAFFSPRLLKARLEAPQMLVKALADPDRPDSRKIMEEFGRSVIRTSGAIAVANRMGAEIDNDPSSPNFWKVKVGDQMVDLMGDWRNQAQFVMRFLQAKTDAFGKPGGNLGIRDTADEAWRGFSTAQVKAGHDLLRQRDSNGKPYGFGVDAAKVLGEMFTPGVVNEIMKGFREGHPGLGAVRGAGKAVGISVSADPNAGKPKPR